MELALRQMPGLAAIARRCHRGRWCTRFRRPAVALAVCVGTLAAIARAPLPGTAWLAARTASIPRPGGEGLLDSREGALAPAWLAATVGNVEASQRSEPRVDAGDSNVPRRLLAGGVLAAVALTVGWASEPAPGQAEVIKGNAPPTDYGLGKNFFKKNKASCSNVEDCQAIGDKKYADEYSAVEESKYEVTASGARFKDMVQGVKADGVAATGQTVRLRYKVMRQGKRSRDGVSGEASTIFSLGYGEDDGPKDAVLTTKLGEGELVKALDEGIVGMAVGGRRRIQVRPDRGLGWRKVGKCAETNTAATAIAGIPNAGVENEETCIDLNKQPAPADYAAKRRFARRFDESLIVEVDLVGVGAS
mmetsp:Transcript_43147/g.94042  ORF Transcript_43147/g.94042 Transcript_43147/m.94042 type:complete len:362 (-) Transcript_43147:59-1144(-)